MSVSQGGRLARAVNYRWWVSLGKGTSRAALNRVLDEDNTSITLTTLSRTAAALGCRLNLEIVAAR